MLVTIFCQYKIRNTATFVTSSKTLMLFLAKTYKQPCFAEFLGRGRLPGIHLLSAEINLTIESIYFHKRQNKLLFHFNAAKYFWNKKEISFLKSLKHQPAFRLYTCSINNSITFREAPSAAAPVLCLQVLIKQPSSANVFLSDTLF